jgi:hypothetical protein
MPKAQKLISEPNHSPVGERLRLIRFRMTQEKLRFWDEVRLIPKRLFLWVVVLFLVAQTAAQIIIATVGEPAWPGMSATANILANIGIITAWSIHIALVIFLIGYVNRDSKRRGMNSKLWTILVVMLLPAYLATGFIIYFLLREPLPYSCPNCSATVSARYNFCPDCKFILRPACPQCTREVKREDRYCPHCAHDLGEGSETA